MGNVVLVHGAWGGPWCWEEIEAGLRARGHTVRAPELHRGDLAGDTAAVQAAVDELGGSAVVCGWSYGGAVITGLELGRDSHLVYVAAFNLDEGESVLGLASAETTLLSSAIVPAADGTSTLSSEALDAALWADAPADAARSAAERLRPQAMAPMTETTARQAWKSTPSTYVVCGKDEALAPSIQRRLAERAGTVVEWDCSHSPMLSRPADLVNLLDELAS